jgi:hypothetical protein
MGFDVLNKCPNFKRQRLDTLKKKIRVQICAKLSDFKGKTADKNKNNGTSIT